MIRLKVPNVKLDHQGVMRERMIDTPSCGLWFFLFVLAMHMPIDLLRANSPQTHRGALDTMKKDMKVSTSTYGTTLDGQQIMAFNLSNGNHVEIELLEYGAIVSSVRVPDKEGNVDDIVLGYDNLEDWENDPYYFGATVGRVANRTGGAAFKLDGETYQLVPNTLPDFGRNHLHGGEIPFNKVVWKGTPFSNEEEVGVVMEYLSEHLEEGYPGSLACKVTYSLNRKNELKMVFEAESDRTTIVNMTHHSYFNLSGAGQGTIHDHQIKINAGRFTVADDDLIPTGEVLPVKDLPIDFTSLAKVGSRIPKMQEQKFTGFDLNYVLDHTDQGSLDLAGQAIDPLSGRILSVHTTQPCLHFYTSNFLEGKPGRSGKKYQQYGAFCFEPQGYPDAANKPAFEPIVLKPGAQYRQTIIYSFSIQK